MIAELTDGWFAGGSLADLGPASRADILSVPACEEAVRRVLGERRGESGREAHLLSVLLVWNDHLDEAHGLVQNLSDPEAAFVHGVVHRREPDYANARYWFQRVGLHPLLEPLADHVAPVLAARPALPHRLIREGRWDPMAFIDAVSAARRLEDGAPEVALLRELQRCELMLLARHLGPR